MGFHGLCGPLEPLGLAVFLDQFVHRQPNALFAIACIAEEERVLRYIRREAVGQAERELPVSLNHGPYDALDDFHQPGVREVGQINPSIGYQTFGCKKGLRVEGPGFNLGDQGRHVFIRHGLLFSQLEIDLGRLRLVGLAIGLGEAREAIADKVEDFLLSEVIGIAHHLKGFLQFGACSGGEKASLMEAQRAKRPTDFRAAHQLDQVLWNAHANVRHAAATHQEWCSQRTHGVGSLNKLKVGE